MEQSHWDCQHHGRHTITLCPDGKHYAKETCEECGRFVKWLPKPKNEGKRPKNKHTAASLEINYCQMCCRHRSKLGNGGSLEVHHVEEISSGGGDIPENIWVVCTSCHRMIHHFRVYLNDHFIG